MFNWSRIRFDIQTVEFNTKYERITNFVSLMSINNVGNISRILGENFKLDVG